MWWISLLVLGAFVPPSLANEGVQIFLDVSKTHAHAGDNVTFICRMTNVPEDGYMFWAKSVLTVGMHEQVDLIGGGQTKLAPYDTFPNYKVSMSTTDNTVFYTLTITNVNVQETGHYVCSYREIEENAFEMVTFNVYDQVDSIRLFLNTTNEEINEDNGIEAESDIPLTLEIDVGNTVPDPDFLVYIGEEDVTESFDKKYDVNIHCQGAFSKDCPLHFTQRIRAVSQTFMFKPEYRGEKMLISAEVPGSGFERVNVTYPLLVNYAPIYKCFTLHAARVGESFSLECKVRGYPMPETFFWLIPKGEGNYTIDARGHYVSTGFYDASCRHLPSEGNTWLVTLKINNVGAENFHNYYLQAGSSLGNTTWVMELMEDIPPTENPNSGSLMSINAVLMFGSLLSILQAIF